MSFLPVAIGRQATSALSSARNYWSAQNGAATLSGLSWKDYYDLQWQFYLNTSYIRATNADPFGLTRKYLDRLKIYPKTRGIYNPITRLVDFYVDNVHGGPLDLDAGDGSLIQTAIPIVPSEDNSAPERAKAIRRAVSRTWKDSNWDIQKSDYVRYGAALGNVGLRVVDDVGRGQVRFDIVFPGEVVDLQLDARGNVIFWSQEYESEARLPDGTTEAFTFGIEITPDEFRTFRNGFSFGYEESGGLAVWANPYGFVPCVWIKHKNSGTDLGLCAYHHAIPKINDLNEIASHLGEQLRKMVHPQWLISGAAEPASRKFTSDDKVWTTLNESARPWPLNDNVDVGAVVGALKSRIDEIEKDFPELTFHIIRERMGNGDLPARAVRMILHDAVARVQEARVNYDAGLIRADKMAMSIGGFRRYQDYAGFDVRRAFEEGRLDHNIGFREIIPPDEMERLQLATTGVSVARLFIDAEQSSGLTSGELMARLRQLGAMAISQSIEDPGITLLSTEMKAMADEKRKLEMEVQRNAAQSQGQENPGQLQKAVRPGNR